MRAASCPRYLIIPAIVCLCLTNAPSALAQPDPAIQRLDDAVKTLEQRQSIVIEAMEKTYQHGFWFIAIAVSITTLLSAIRYLQDQRLMKDAQEIGKSYKTNIETTNQLMLSIKNALDYYQKAQDMERKVEELKALQTAETQRTEGQMADLNDAAMDLSPQCKRASHNDPDVQRLVRDFHGRYEILRRSAQTSEQLNANGHFILGFHYRIENNYGEALKEFELARNAAIADKSQQVHPAYRKLPDGVSLSHWLTKLVNICAYHSAILKNNLGLYNKAKEDFEVALTHDPLDYQALAYIPETMFLGSLASFSKVVEEFRAVIAKVEKLTTDEAQRAAFSLSKEKLLALLYVKLANCYMAESSDADYKAHRDPLEAQRLVRTALQHDPTSLFAKLSLAQLLAHSGQEPQRMRDLFVEVFESAKTVVSRVTEAKILMLYYYTMLICCLCGEIRGEAAGLYVIRLFELVPKLPVPPKDREKELKLKLFSPLSKRDLDVGDFTSEAQAFEATTQSPKRGEPAISLTDDAPPPAFVRPEVQRRHASVGGSLLDGE